MKNPLLLAALLATAAPATVASAQTVPSRFAWRLAQGEPQRVVVYGTSLTAGNLWPEALRKSLERRYPGRLTWSNAAGSGMNSDWGVANLDERVIAKRPDVVFVEFAVNDAVARFHISVPRAERNLRAMIRRLRAANPDVEIVLQITNPVIDRPLGDPGYRPLLQKDFEMVRRVAREERTVLLDHEARWARFLDQGPVAYRRLVPDGLHPSAAGYDRVVARAILEGLGVPAADAFAQSREGGRESFDLLVYGGTSAAVTAAVQAKRMGKRVLLLSPDRHLGGLTINGLGWTDLGNAHTIGGLARDFYRRVYAHYAKPDAWTWQPRQTFGGAAQGTKARDDASGTMWTFEPHVAERILADLIEEADVPVVYGRLSDVYRRGGGLVGVRTAEGYRYAARAFVDATYEGDLMALAGVGYAVGREANALYGEGFDGKQQARAVKNQLPKGIDPYGAKGRLLPGVEPASDEPDGTGDRRIQAYCYRMVLTDVPENRIRIEKPDGFREADYEILFRAIAAGQKDAFFKLDPVPNRKTDSNNASGVSTDLIGGSYGYPEGDAATRERIAQAHERWQRGLIWTLQNSPRVPEAIRRRYAPWGLPKDEFVDNGGWPYGLYVREARRMVGETVVTENSLRDKAGPARPIGMGSYQMDSHNVRRMVGPDGFLMNEGDVQQSTNGPYGIDLGAILPKEAECTNLFVPICVSATHIAYGSIRMEPVFMILGQSAASAAAQALDAFLPAQRLDYARLAERLRADGQVLRLP